MIELEIAASLVALVGLTYVGRRMAAKAAR